MSEPLLALENVTVRHLNRVLFSNLTFRLEPGQHWALVGESGSGKSALLTTLAGQLTITGGRATYSQLDALAQERAAATHDPLFTWRRLVSLVPARPSFRTLANTTDIYYQQRFNATDTDSVPTVEDYLRAVPLAAAAPHWTYERVATLLRLTHLQAQRLIKLSNGETRRLLLAAALLRNPALLLLDMPLTGLDAQSRAAFDELLAAIMASGITVIMATSPHEVPAGITHVAVLQAGRVAATVEKAGFHPDQLTAAGLPTLDETELRALLALTPPPQFQTIVRLDDVTISYGNKTVLDHINWEVKPGERWALTGPNGAGKSTLLSLLNGDNPQAYRQRITLFDRRRGSGESIWDIKRQIGFVSPELFQYFPARQSCLHIIESGFYETLGLLRPSQPDKAAIARRWLRLLGLEEHAATPFRQVATSVQRLCLLARALVRNPPLYLFDEPCQGLDAQQQQHFRHVLDRICQVSNVTLIYVSHYPHEIPQSVTQVLRLEQGRRVEG
ncbi:ATP-binding cassette domain-containing protein [Hymenobacter sp. BT507]|uniref:ATP-binding cassette domain-containing protein n=1 Tax=Hymenobacter citatus TaxID=2763506 RepID=A0ABR7MNQ2_9BACT|nr:ATP-binding cassette domain-containing protein [Hymenobacter citatus]MBC6612713.1 ATP-binding cassette domain-containing protein [Hymenobacter citatus]